MHPDRWASRPGMKRGPSGYPRGYPGRAPRRPVTREVHPAAGHPKQYSTPQKPLARLLAVEKMGSSLDSADAGVAHEPSRVSTSKHSASYSGSTQGSRSHQSKEKRWQRSRHASGTAAVAMPRSVVSARLRGSEGAASSGFDPLQGVASLSNNTESSQFGTDLGARQSSTVHNFWRGQPGASSSSGSKQSKGSQNTAAHGSSGSSGTSTTLLQWARQAADMAGRTDAGSLPTVGQRDVLKLLEVHLDAGTDDHKQRGVHREKQPFVAGIAGTPLFMAPELFKHQGQRASDYWSLGVTLFWLLAGRMPFEGIGASTQLSAAKAGRVSWHLLPNDLSHECLDLLRGLLEVRVEKRYNASVLAAHPWLLPRSDSTRNAIVSITGAHGGVGQSIVVAARWKADNPFMDPAGGVHGTESPSARARPTAAHGTPRASEGGKTPARKRLSTDHSSRLLTRT